MARVHAVYDARLLKFRNTPMSAACRRVAEPRVIYDAIKCKIPHKQSRHMGSVPA